MREGANQALNILVRYLEERAGCSVRVYSPVTATPAFEPAGTLIPVPSVRLPVRGEFQLALGLPAAIRADMMRFRPDIVHLSTPDILGSRALGFARKQGIPVVASMHTRFETYLDYYRLGWARALLDTHLHRFYRRCDHVVAPTRILVEELKALRGDDHASVWSRGIDAALFRPEQRDMAWRRAQGIGDDDIMILFFGRLVLEKGIDAFVAIIRRLQAHNPRIRALVVGAGPAGDAFSALHGSVLTGHLSGDALARAVASADMKLSMSLTETFGNVLVEAMACGLPVISADAQNARSILNDGKNGFIRPQEDSAAFVALLAALADDPAWRRRIGQAARQESLLYSWDAASQSVAQVYRTLARMD
ncbi:glycosyltransferase [Sphingobium sp. CAP-1]|nr:glycosyltransferase [Sphingobium sp. CAP-1]